MKLTWSEIRRLQRCRRPNLTHSSTHEHWTVPARVPPPGRCLAAPLSPPTPNPAPPSPDFTKSTHNLLLSNQHSLAQNPDYRPKLMVSRASKIEGNGRLKLRNNRSRNWAKLSKKKGVRCLGDRGRRRGGWNWSWSCEERWTDEVWGRRRERSVG